MAKNGNRFREAWQTFSSMLSNKREISPPIRYNIQNNCDSDLKIHLGPQINARDVNNLNTKTIGIFIGNCKCSSSPRSALLLKLFLFLGVVSATVGLTFYTITYTTTTTGMIFYEAFIILTDRREFYYIKHHHQQDLMCH